MKQILYSLLFALCIVGCSKSGPTDEQLRDLCRDAANASVGLSDSQKESETFNKIVAEASANFDILKITPAQVELMFDAGGESLKPYLSEWLAPTLATKADTDSTIFAFYAWKYYPGYMGFLPSAEVIEAYKKLICKSDIAEFVQNNPEAADEILAGASAMKGDQWIEYGIVPQVKALLTYPLSDNVATKTVNLFNTAFTSSLPDEKKEEIRQQVLGIYQNLADNTTSVSRKKRMQAQIDYLQGAFATNTLIGNKAPELHFKWISRGKENTLDDFKGKVVVLDFWATKCAPCIALFPKLAELQQHYKNSPVAIIGVTSIMGYFVDTPNKRTINTANNPEKEIALMTPYMKDMGMTWRVAFSEEDVMNTDYGALAIPHVTIIDKQGRVRYNNVRGTNEDKIKLIDGLLSE